MRSSYRLMLFLSGAFVLGVVSGNHFSLQDSFAQGYSGLIAGPEDSGDKTRQQPGYRGLIPGYVPDLPEQQAPGSADSGERRSQPQAQHRKYESSAPRRAAAPSPYRRERQRERPRTAGMTQQPGYEPPPRIRTIDDIKVAAQTMNMDKGKIRWEDGLHPKMKQTLSSLFDPQQREALAVPSIRMDGMLPGEYMAKKKIDQIMYFVRDPGQTKEQRKANAAKAADKLRSLAYGYRAEAEVPDILYETMGLPDTYRKERREAARNALARAEAALAELRKYQR